MSDIIIWDNPYYRKPSLTPPQHNNLSGDFCFRKYFSLTNEVELCCFYLNILENAVRKRTNETQSVSKLSKLRVESRNKYGAVAQML